VTIIAEVEKAREEYTLSIIQKDYIKKTREEYKTSTTQKDHLRTSDRLRQRHIRSPCQRVLLNLWKTHITLSPHPVKEA
jgi:hypothetical protein